MLQRLVELEKKKMGGRIFRIQVSTITDRFETKLIALSTVNETNRFANSKERGDSASAPYPRTSRHFENLPTTSANAFLST